MRFRGHQYGTGAGDQDLQASAGAGALGRLSEKYRILAAAGRRTVLGLAMSKTYRRWKIDQPLLLAARVQDFVGENHLARFILALVLEDLDLGQIGAAEAADAEEDRGFGRDRERRRTARRHRRQEEARREDPGGEGRTGGRGESGRGGQGQTAGEGRGEAKGRGPQATGQAAPRRPKSPISKRPRTPGSQSTGANIGCCVQESLGLTNG